MKKIKQFRYYGERNPKTYPFGLTYGALHSGNIFSSCGAVSQLGIQAEPGTTFYLNESEFSIKVGATGIYELDLENVGRLTSIRFSKESLEKAKTNNCGIIIDIIYEGAGI